MPETLKDADFLRRAITLSRSATAKGNHPFGALLVDADGDVLIEAENSFMPSHDATAHAERLVATQASIRFRPRFSAA